MLIQSQAGVLAQSDIIPQAYRRKPANIIAAAMSGRDFGWDVMTSIRNGHVIEGQWTLKPEAMLALIRRAGHSVKIERRADGVMVTGTRSDGEHDSMEVTFTFDDAVRAGLVKLKDGQPFARSSSGKPMPWEQYPVTMCQWRAIAILGKGLFSDVTLGVYSAEELGAELTVDGEVVEDSEVHVGEAVIADEPQPLSSTALERFADACVAEGLDPDDVLAESGVLNNDGEPLTDADLPAMRDAFHRMIEQKASVPIEVRPATRGQVGKIKSEYERLNVVDRKEQLAATAKIIGRELGSHNELTHDEAVIVRDALEQTPDPPPEMFPNP
jgi:hypothetical protein